MEKTLDLPPFPPLEWEESYGSGDWKSPLTLPAWEASQDGHERILLRASPMPSDGLVTLSVASPDRVGALPTAEQAAAYLHLVDHQGEIRDAILQAVFDRYPEEQEAYGYTDEEAEELMPDLQSRDQLRTLVSLLSVYILTVAKRGTAYVSFEFRCRWDVEHGLGAMTHAGRVVEVGGADTALLGWIATRDAEGG